MIAFLVCLVVFAASIAGLYRAFVLPLQREVATLKRTFGAHEIRSKELHRRARADIAGLRKLSGQELEAVSERLDEIETRATVLE